MKKILKVEQIQKYYGNKDNITKAINGISFDVEEGEFIGIMGASGSGKTTLLNCISTIDTVSSGHIYLENQDITEIKEENIAKFRRENLGFIFQDFNLLDTLTVEENIALILTINKVPEKEIDKKTLEIARKLGIEEILNKYPYQVSGGQKQRCAVCRAIVNNSKIVMSTSHTNTGIIVVPDNCPLTDDMKEMHFLAANYNDDTEEGKKKIEELFSKSDSAFIQSLDKKGLEIDGLTKTRIMEGSIGIATIVTFIAIYLGVIFLIASSAILALKQLTDASDNKQRYTILRKIGCDEKMINKSLFRQIGIFFGVPLVLAIIHSIFGIQFAVKMMSGLASEKDLLPSAVVTVVVIGVIYGAYFLATYFGSKNIIKEE